MTLPEESPQVINLSQSRLDHVQAELVRARLSGILEIAAEEAEFHGSMAMAVNTGSLVARDSVLGLVDAEKADINDSVMFVAAADLMKTDNSVAGVLVSNELKADNIRAGLVISRTVNGNVETLLDTRQALLAGVLGGAVAGMLLLFGRYLFGPRK